MLHALKLLLVALALAAIGAVGFVYLDPQTATRIALDAQRSRAGLVRKQLDLPGGLRYVYLEGGSGEPLLLLHGFSADKDNFARVARFLTPHYRVIVPDHIGFGESSQPPQADYSVGAQAQRLHALAQALGLGKVHLGGSSMGGQIAMHYAARFPGETDSLWLLDPGGVWSAPRGELAQIVLGGGRNPLIARSEDDFARTYGFVMQDPPFVPRPMLNVLAQKSIRNAGLWEKIFTQIATEPVEKVVDGMTTPTLIVWGEQDRVIHPASAAILHRLLPRSQVILMPGVGHLPMLERPRQCAQDYLQFRAGLTP